MNNAELVVFKSMTDELIRLRENNRMLAERLAKDHPEMIKENKPVNLEGEKTNEN